MYYIDGDDNYNSCLGLSSISHRRSPSGSCFYCCAVLSVWRINLELPQDFHRISIWGTGAGACSQSCLLLGGSEAHIQEAQLSMARSDALLRLVFDNVKPVAFPQMSCTLLCPSATAVPCLLCYYPWHAVLPFKAWLQEFPHHHLVGRTALLNVQIHAMEETDRELTAYCISNCEEVQKRQYSILLSSQLAIHAVFSFHFIFKSSLQKRRWCSCSPPDSDLKP